MSTEVVHPLAMAAGEALKGAGLKLCCAESCTGGLIAKMVTDVAGSSIWFERAYITYSNEAKCESLGVSPGAIENDGAVSETVARQMALGALQHSAADVAIAVTGVAGPDGGSAEKPVGTVWFGWAYGSDSVVTECCQFDGSRTDVRLSTAEHALSRLIERLQL
ncbi:MAG: CinA family protein [Pseudomonadota bacterium]